MLGVEYFACDSKISYEIIHDLDVRDFAFGAFTKGIAADYFEVVEDGDMSPGSSSLTNHWRGSRSYPAILEAAFTPAAGVIACSTL